VDDLMLVFEPDGPLFTGRVLLGDRGGERGAVAVSTFEKISFGLMIARLAEQVSTFVEKEEQIGVTLRRTDLAQPAMRLDEETILMLHADPVAVIRTLSPSPVKIVARRPDPATMSPLRIGYDAIASTFGDEVFIRRRGDQVECPCCGRWADVKGDSAVCRSMACMARLPVTMRSDRWASLPVPSLLVDEDREKFFFPREWNKPGPWVTREDLEKQYRGWLTIKQEFIQ
jgi:hypothetical protein